MEIKIFDNYEEMLEAAKAAGIKESRLNKAVDVANVPSEGEFQAPELSIDGSMSHIRAKFNEGSTCSHSRLRGQAHFGTREDATFVKGKKPETSKGFFLNTKVLNPAIPADGCRLVFLKGKKFTAAKRVGFVLPYVEDENNKPVWHTTEASARKALVAKDFWELTITD